MATQNTHPFSYYSYSIQLLMWPTLKVLKCVNRHSSQKFTNKTTKTLHDHFWWSIWKFDTFFSVIYSCYELWYYFGFMFEKFLSLYVVINQRKFKQWYTYHGIVIHTLICMMHQFSCILYFPISTSMWLATFVLCSKISTHSTYISPT